MGPSMLVFDFSQLGPSVSLRSFGQPDLLLPAFSCGRMGFPIPVFDSTHLGPSALIRSLARLGLVSLAFGISCPEPTPLVPDAGCPGSFLLARSPV